MITPIFKYCPRCAGSLEIVEHEGEQVQVCSVCHNILFKNQNICVDAVIVRDGAMLFSYRARDPMKGALDIPGGFVKANEKPQHAIVREVKEELRVDGTIKKLLGVYGPGKYEYKGVTEYNTALIYSIDIGNQTPKPSDDVGDITWIPLTSLPDPKELAFTTEHEFLRDVIAGKVHLL